MDTTEVKKGATITIIFLMKRMRRISMKKVIIILLYLVSSALVAMEEEKSAPDDFTQTEKIFESYENNGSKCTCCLFTELPALKIQPLGDPLIDVEAIMRATVYGQWALSLSQEAKNQEVYKLLRDSRRAAFFDKDVVLKGYPHLRRHWAILVAAGADANVKDNNTSLLKTAILCEDRQFADFLLRHKANVNKESVHEEWPIFCAKDEEMAALLVSYGADVKIRGGAWGRSLVQEAIERSQAGKSVDLIKYYLGQGVDINATNDNEGTVLHSLAYGSADYQEKKSY